MNLQTLALAALVVLAIPAAAAQPESLLEARGSALVLDGPAEATGGLGFVSDQFDISPNVVMQPGDDTRTPPLGLRMHGSSVDIVTDVRTLEPTVLFLSPPTETRQETVALHEGASISLYEIRERYSFFISPLEGAQAAVDVAFTAGTLRAAPSHGESVQMVSPTTTPALRAGAGAGQELANARSWQTLIIRGDFALSLWEVDVDVNAPGRDLRLHTGSFFESSSPAPTGDLRTVGRVEERQSYIYVHDGVLEFTFDGTPSLTLNLKTESATVDGQATLVGAQGTLQTPDGPVDVRGDVTVAGALHIVLAKPRADSFDATLSGQATKATAAGRVIMYPASTGVGVPAPALWLAGAGAFLIVGAGLPAAVARRRALARDMANLELLMDANRYREAIAATTARLVGSRRHGTDAQVIRTVSLLRLGRTAEAAATLEGWRGRQDAPFEYLWAFLHALRGEARQARERVAMCLGKDPSMEDDVASNAVLRAVLAQPGPAAPVQREGYS